jgi:hypothetical protein
LGKGFSFGFVPEIPQFQEMAAYSPVLFFMPFIVAFIVLGGLLILVWAIRGSRSAYRNYSRGRYRRGDYERGSLKLISQSEFARGGMLWKYWPVFVSVLMITTSLVALVYSVGLVFFPLFISGFTLLILGTPLWTAFYRDIEAKKRQR